MRTLMLIGLAGLALAAGAIDAEARGGRLRFGGLGLRGPVPTASIHAVPGATTPAPGLAIRRDLGVGARPTYVVLPSSPQRPEPADGRSMAEAAASAAKPSAETPPPPAAKAAEAAPWCRSQRIAGSGAGFCLIN